jgi:metal-responsive CopG/Arc/MetJ family transcriptional regulator
MNKMIRTNYYFPRQMLDELKAASKKHGLPISEIIRRAITDWLARN